MRLQDWYLTVWQKGAMWQYRIEKGPERRVMAQGVSAGDVTGEFVREVVWGEYRRLVRARIAG